MQQAPSGVFRLLAAVAHPSKYPIPFVPSGKQIIPMRSVPCSSLGEIAVVSLSTGRSRRMRMLRLHVGQVEQDRSSPTPGQQLLGDVVLRQDLFDREPLQL